MVRGPIQLSASVLSKDEKLLDGQLLGRLGLFSEIEIRSLLEYIWENRSGIRILPLNGNLTPPGGPLLYILDGYSGWINAISITPDGGLLFQVQNMERSRYRILKQEKKSEPNRSFQ